MERMERFMEDTFAKAKKYGVSVRLTNEVLIGSVECNGSFEDNPPVLIVDTSVPNWQQTFVHEACHMDQWIQKSPYWITEKFNGITADTLFEVWLSGNMEFLSLVDSVSSPLSLKRKVIDIMRDAEWDCELRAVARIHEYDLPIDAQEYSQKANAYILFYNWVALTRQWYPKGFAPYQIPELYRAMPDVISPDREYYSIQNFSDDHFELFQKIYSSI